MLIEFLERKREEPRHKRQRFVFFAAVGITSVIAAIWAITLPMRFSFADMVKIGDKGEESINDLSDVGKNSSNSLQQLIDSQNQMSGEAKEAANALSALASDTPEGIADPSYATSAAGTMTWDLNDSGTQASSAPQTSSGPRTVLIATTTASTTTQN